MNRKIIFRGWSTTESKWVYGHLVSIEDDAYIFPMCSKNEFYKTKFVPVEFDSIGQYVITIGSTDIYEGDIVFALGGCDGQTRQGIVRYDIEGSGFWINISEDESYVPLSARPVTFQTGETELFFYEVIGNEYEEKLKISNP